MIARATASWCACPAARIPTRCSIFCSRCSAARRCSFELLAVNLDQKQPGFPEHVLPEYLTLPRGAAITSSSRTPTASSSASIPEGRTMCGLCSRLRRGALYRFAAENGITKIALGHHRDDIVETLFLNLFFGGRLKAMAPKLLSEDGRHIVDPAARLRRRARHRALRPRPRIPHHPLQAVRLAGQHAARGDQEDARRLGARLPGPHREHLFGLAPRRARAPRRSAPLRFRRSRRAAGPTASCAGPRRGDYADDHGGRERSDRGCGRRIRNRQWQSLLLSPTPTGLCLVCCWPASTRPDYSRCHPPAPDHAPGGRHRVLPRPDPPERDRPLRPGASAQIDYLRKPIRDHSLPAEARAHDARSSTACTMRCAPAGLPTCIAVPASGAPAWWSGASSSSAGDGRRGAR